ncbi:uracil-DNA glycosylase [Campylobacter volucris]|uniref:uracil-DNA glycosylase n=1 Tax=Campylobacter volucris TaxID=1031542 RepID=UPI00105970C6|nr:uracil-DNA glycosylase [Campylobacter volucris]MBF7043947.1 uracil-DNA glycosylase [Campylobacter volucris]MBF7047189.1 uracil-DNA glycosylase [Campylobacter volucris]MBF7068737.1 uracil-DNA glycosylase [Campylobacter volucris]TDJ81914.1 uracil-DNA glycosylase [Campylobacter volucris]
MVKNLQIDINKININEDWKEFLKDEFLKPYFANIKYNYIQALQRNEIIYPPSNLIFNAFNLTPLKDLKIILLGQDPYHGKDQAMGLSFSVPFGVKTPPSLINIYKELFNDLNIPIANHGNLSKWAKQGVLLLNSILSVQANKPASHANFGWQEFSDNIILKLSKERQNLIFLLWGNYAKSKKNLIDQSKHFVLEAAHPSPLARGAFFGSKHFSKSNEILKKLGKTPIDWDLNL